jgi:hypothetical protein
VEVGVVARREGESVPDRRCGDPEIVGADRFAAVGESCPDVSVDPSDRFCDRDRLKAGEEVLDKTPAGGRGSRLVG